VRSYPFLNTPLQHYIDLESGLWVYCACGHNDLLKPTHTLARYRDLSTWELMSRLRCQKCGVVGAVERITVVPMSTLHQPHWALNTDR
jgi:hypothetical protein